MKHGCERHRYLDGKRASAAQVTKWLRIGDGNVRMQAEKRRWEELFRNQLRKVKNSHDRALLKHCMERSAYLEKQATADSHHIA